MKSIRELIRKSLLEYFSRREVDDVKNYADRLFSDVGVEVDFSDHFFDRLNDPRNEEEIEPDEVKTLYAKAKAKYGNTIAGIKDKGEAVLTDRSSDINIPIVMTKGGRNGDKDMIGKTIMRKRNFHSSTPILKV